MTSSGWDCDGAGGGGGTCGPAPIAHWKFDETSGATAADSASGNDGTLANSPVWQTAGGLIDGALEFDETNDVVTAGSDASLDDLGPMSVSAWIYPQTQGENNAGWIVGKATGGSDPPDRERR
jgi:hypothetical protein